MIESANITFGMRTASEWRPLEADGQTCVGCGTQIFSGKIWQMIPIGGFIFGQVISGLHICDACRGALSPKL